MIVPMAQIFVEDLIQTADRLDIRHLAGPTKGPQIDRVEMAQLDALESLTPGTLAIVPLEEDPAQYRVDVALRRASAQGIPALVFVGPVTLTATAQSLADHGGVTILSAPHAKPSDIAVTIDRLLTGGTSETMTRAGVAIEQATLAAATPNASVEDIIGAAGRALGFELALVADPTVSWNDNDAVCVGEVPIGRLTAPVEPAAAFAVPVVAALASRAAQRHIRDRYAPTQSRADLIVELILAESARVEGFIGQAAQLGFPLPLSHAVSWLKPTNLNDPHERPPHGVEPALELFAMQLVEGRGEMWHVAFLQGNVLIVCTEEHGAGDHQRRLLEVAVRIQQQAVQLAGADWAYTLGMGTPQLGAAGLRQSATEARIAAESAVAAGRSGDVAFTDVTGLRRVLLDLYASPISRNLLDDILAPLDALGHARAMTAVRTLASYLSHRNSLSQAGKELNLHPNAVGYRLKRIRESLQIDLDDPDTRFSVELACRVRLLGDSRR